MEENKYKFQSNYWTCPPNIFCDLFNLDKIKINFLPTSKIYIKLNNIV